MIPNGLNKTAIDRLLDAAIEEDIGKGDLTSQAVIPPGINFEGVMAAREEMVCAGLPLAGLVFSKFSNAISWEALVNDGQKVPGGAELGRGKHGRQIPDEGGPRRVRAGGPSADV